MKRYNVKCRKDRIEFIDIIRETEDGYMIQITRISDGIENTREETITRHLFNICIKTGFICEMLTNAASVA